MWRRPKTCGVFVTDRLSGSMQAAGAAGSGQSAKISHLEAVPSVHDEASGTSSLAGSRAAVSASSVAGHYQTAANTGSLDDQYRDVTPNDDQYRDVMLNDDQRTNDLYEQAAAGKSGYNIAAAAGAQRVGADHGSQKVNFQVPH